MIGCRSNAAPSPRSTAFPQMAPTRSYAFVSGPIFLQGWDGRVCNRCSGQQLPAPTRPHFDPQSAVTVGPLNGWIAIFWPFLASYTFVSNKGPHLGMQYPIKPARWLGASATIGLILLCPPAARAATPAQLISGFRLAHGEGKVATDAALNHIAQEQASAMATRDVLEHDALRPFSARVTQLGSIRSAENIAYGYDTFAKTLDQWIGSSGHRTNLLMHGASRVGIASAKSSKSGRTYWAMVIAAPEPKLEKRGKGGKAKACRIMLNDTCL